MAEAGNARARLALGSLSDLNHQLAGAQLGITMASLLLGFVAEPTVAGLVEDAVTGVVELPDSVLHTIGFAVALTIVVFLHMVVGAMVPMNISISAPARTHLAPSLPTRAYLAVLGRVLRVLPAFPTRCVRLVGVGPRNPLPTA